MDITPLAIILITETLCLMSNKKEPVGCTVVLILIGMVIVWMFYKLMESGAKELGTYIHDKPGEAFLMWAGISLYGLLFYFIRKHRRKNKDRQQP